MKLWPPNSFTPDPSQRRSACSTRVPQREQLYDAAVEVRGVVEVVLHTTQQHPPKVLNAPMLYRLACIREAFDEGYGRR
jgi:hypothetical protein